MSGTTRIPVAEITGFKGALIKRFAKKTLGRVPSSIGTDDGHDTAISFVVKEGRISRIYAVRNPAKLGRLAVEATLSR